MLEQSQLLRPWSAASWALDAPEPDLAEWADMVDAHQDAREGR